jgi:hypothetical protein
MAVTVAADLNHRYLGGDPAQNLLESRVGAAVVRKFEDVNVAEWQPLKHR